MARIFAFALTLILLNGSMAFSQTERGTDRHFEKVRLLEPVGDNGDSLKATKVMVRFDTDRFVLQTLRGEEIKVFPYSSLKRAGYVFAKGPRYKSSVGMALLANVFASYFVSKLLFEWVLGRGPTSSLSI